MDPVTLTIFTYIGGSIEGILAAFVAPAIARLMPALTLFASVAVTLYIVLTGLAIALGAVRQPLQTFLAQAAKILFVTLIALNATHFGDYVLEFFRGLEAGLSGLLNPTAPTASIYATLDATVNRGFSVASFCFDRAAEGGRVRWVTSAQSWSWMLAGLILGSSTIAVTIVGGALIIVAKVAVALLFAIGPLFILLLMFPVTARMFDAWITQVIGFTLTVVLIGTVMGFAVVMFDNFIDEVGSALAGESVNPFIAAGQVMILSLALVWMTFKSQQMAGMLGGGFSSAALSLSDAMFPARVAARGAGRIGSTSFGLGRTTRFDIGRGREVNQSLLVHRVQGNTTLNPAYRQHLRLQVGRNWGSGSGGTARDTSAS